MVKDEIPLLSPKAFLEHTTESFYAYIKNMMNSNRSKEVRGVSISVGKADKITIRIEREEKIVSREELELLAQEYNIDEMKLLTLFIKRKIGISYDNSPKRESDIAAINEAKANARAERLAMRKKAGNDKFLKPKRNSRLHEESTIQPTTEPEARAGISSDSIRECDT